MFSMCATSSTSDPSAAVAARLAAAGSIVITSHDRPDGDAIGSMMALALAAREAGKTVQVALGEPVPRRYAFLTAGESVLDAAGFARAAAAGGCVAVVDTSTMEQLRAVAPTIAAARQRMVVIDHHQTREDIAAAAWSDPSAAATGVMVVELLDRLGWPLSEPVARAALAAICADTGWMQYANTDGRTLRAAARCLEAGASADELYRTLFMNDRPERLALMGRMLASMTLHAGGRLAMMTITRDDFRQSGAGPDETENLINEALRIGGVSVALLLVEQGSEIRGSLRSRNPAAGAAAVDVAAVAQSLGGGGHARAAGFRMTGTLEQVRDAALAVVERALA
jgi:bifunctional oligoribonuclease and PAP phosphatase NrnA